MTNSIQKRKPIPNLKNVLVLRTDFISEKGWTDVCRLIAEPDQVDGYESNILNGYMTYIDFLSDSNFKGLQVDDLDMEIIKNYKHSFIFLVDHFTFNHREYPVLCVDLYDKPGDCFRVIPSQIWSIENNLSISNMDFEELSASVDSDGIFRGF